MSPIYKKTFRFRPPPSQRLPTPWPTPEPRIAAAREEKLPRARKAAGGGARKAGKQPAKKSKKRQMGRLKRKMMLEALRLLRDQYPKARTNIADRVRRIKYMWPALCKAEGVDPEDITPPRWDMVADAVKPRRR
jgi:hypothetical protein